jgi:bifunctional enzyme CysN/CysC
MDVEDIKEHGIEAYLEAHQKKGLLRFITCGSVDDGKSSLIGRLLYEAKQIYEDQLAAVEADSIKVGTQGGKLDLALLVDGLAAEREQGITIDVAYRYFSTKQRKFIVADTPGHEQYTRNMVTGASTADAAVILIDARKGVLSQTRRHSYICSLLGIRHLVLTINKMDLVDYSEEVFKRIQADFLALAKELNVNPEAVTCIPVSALVGDNVISPSEKMSWYKGKTLLGTLETLEVEQQQEHLPFRMPVQWVSRPDLNFRGFAGYVPSGTLKPGDSVTVLPSGVKSTVKGILGPEGPLPAAVAGQSVTVTLTTEVDMSRGDVLVATESPAQVGDQFRCTIVWMHEEPMFPGRPYLMKIGARTLIVTITEPRYKLNIDTFAHLAAKKLDLNDIGVCNIQTDQPIAFDPYTENRETGGFILIDRLTNDTVGVGMLSYALWRSDNVHWQALDVNKQARSELKGQKACVVWFTGLSGAGKSTIANLLEKRLLATGRHTYLLDGDNVRHGLNNDLGFTDADRVENIRRVAEVARLMVDAGLIVLVSFISPFRSERQMARETLEEGEFIEVFVDTPLEVAEQRDPKGLYKKAREGQIRHFTGIDSAYERPEAPEVHIETSKISTEEAVELVLRTMRSAGKLDSMRPSSR